MIESEALHNAKEEIKRIDHLIYVSLKYTRTCDIFKNIIQRMIGCIDFALESILEQLEKDNKIYEAPAQPGARCNVIKEHVSDEEILNMIKFYLRLRQMNRAEFSREREFRRHVTMTMHIDGEVVEVNIDSITEDYKNCKEYINNVEKFLGGTDA